MKSRCLPNNAFACLPLHCTHFESSMPVRQYACWLVLALCLLLSELSRCSQPPLPVRAGPPRQGSAAHPQDSKQPFFDQRSAVAV